MFRYLNQKVCFHSNQSSPVNLSFASSTQVGIYPVLMTHKEMGVCLKAAVFLSAAATICRVLCVAPCIGAIVHLYSGSLFG